MVFFGMLEAYLSMRNERDEGRVSRQTWATMRNGENGVVVEHQIILFS